MKRHQRVYLIFKRIIDLFGSLIGVIFCGFLLWWWIILINLFASKGHPFFAQERYGKNEKVFKMYKFRSMRIDVDPNVAPSDITPEVQNSMDTKFGYFLRKTSLDETLQLINILFGQMSFIGPRPGSANNEEYLRACRNKYSPSAFAVKPGISGYAQVKMKRAHDPEIKARLDHEYVVNLSFRLDAKIFFYTIAKIFSAIKGH